MVIGNWEATCFVCWTCEQCVCSCKCTVLHIYMIPMLSFNICPVQVNEKKDVLPSGSFILTCFVMFSLFPGIVFKSD